ncbi:MAG TPA: IS1595 family transposase [Bryobacteraceae bacterium]|nr:IS1595 family transposase [Bryobacteraceae bacterium]
MEDSPIGLDKWLPAIWMICGCKNGISSYEMARDLGVSQKSAWFMLHRIRLALKAGSFEKKLSGEVEADGTFVGGKLRLMNQKTRARKLAKGHLKGGGTVGKAIVTGLLERNGEARVKVVAKRRRHQLMTHLRENVEPGSNVFTDELQSYRDAVVDYAHEVIDHTEAYVKGNVHTNGMENFWSLFKRALKGTYVSVEPFHLQAYADEQCFRFNNRRDADGNPLGDADRFEKALAQLSGKRLTFVELIGREPDSPMSWGHDSDAGSVGPNSVQFSELNRPYPWETNGGE